MRISVGQSVLAFVAAYVAIVALSLPGATVATLTGGFLFGMFPGVLLNVTGATIGACLIFLAARAGFGRASRRGWMARTGRWRGWCGACATTSGRRFW
jgi:uncharacterized membrane protein YdjX (TVP38/TMEM64 family)